MEQDGDKFLIEDFEEQGFREESSVTEDFEEQVHGSRISRRQFLD